jgi:hypothetical protein
LRPYRRLLTALLAVATLIMAGLPVANAQDASASDATITGRVVHGVDGTEFDASKVVVTLNVLEGVTAFDPVSVAPEADGTFAFDVTAASDRTYFVGVEYQGARYSDTRTLTDLTDEVLIQVYDSTHDTTVLRFVSYSVIVAGAVAKDGWVEIIERASVLNESGMTLIPDPTAEGPAMLSFLRFALPPNAFNLDVRSSLVGGDIITVDRGFALTTPVVPTTGEPHLFEFVYRLNYDEPTLDLSRTMRFGAESFRYVVPADTGRPIAAELQDLGATELNERFLRLLEGSGIEPGQVVELSITELPMPSALDRVSASAGTWYVRYAAPAIVIAVLALIALVNLRRRQSLPTLGPDGDAEAVRSALQARLADVESQYAAGKLSQRRYEAYREQIREAMVDLHVRTQEGVDLAG